VTAVASRLFVALAMGVAAAQVQQPPTQIIQNGRVETRTGTSIDREVSALAGAEPVWLMWRVPMVAGDRELCSSYFSDRNVYSRGYTLDWNPPGRNVGGGMPQVSAPTGPVPIEAGTGLLMLVRVFDGGVERLRTLADDCPIDAGGRNVYWLGAVTPAESLRFLESLTRTDRFPAEARRNLAGSALTAISLHRDQGADAILDRMAADGDRDQRTKAAQALANARGAHGFQTLQKLLAAEKDAELRRSFVGALGITRESGTTAALKGFLTDADARIRAEAIYWYAVRGGAPVISEVTRLVENDTDDNVKRRGVSGISRLPANDSIPALLQLAKSAATLVVRKEAVRALGDSRDPRAMAFMESLIKGN
jgi:hypothetical protein